MVIANERMVSLTYDLRVDSESGQLLESIKSESPLTFIYGQGRLLPKFESNLKGLTAGDKFQFNLESGDAYGEFDENAVVNVPKNIFEVDGKMDESLVQLGKQIPMMDKSGNRLNGTVIEILDESVKMDFNHPLAGNNLFFEGEVTEVREATHDELSGCGDSCGCGSESESSGCGSGCGCG